jgi:hypothetical protein
MKEDVLLDELAKQFSGEEKKNEFLVLQTEFGEKSFRMCDVKSIALTDKNGKTTDITDLIQKILENIDGGKI